MQPMTGGKRFLTLTQRSRRLAACFAVMVMGLAASANATELDLEIGGGPLIKPRWEGARDYQVSAFPTIKLHYLSIPGFLTLGGSDQGFAFAPSFRFIDARRQSDSATLTGLGDIDAAFEVGGKVSYRLYNVRALVELRQGFGGHDGIVGAVGLDAIWQPRADLVIEAGPRVSFASSSYMQTYFGVDATQALGSGLAAYDAKGGIKGVGVAGQARWAFSDPWALIVRASYERLVGDAAGSPIIAAGGSQDQFTAGVGLSYRLHWTGARE